MCLARSGIKISLISVLFLCSLFHKSFSQNETKKLFGSNDTVSHFPTASQYFSKHGELQKLEAKSASIVAENSSVAPNTTVNSIVGEDKPVYPTLTKSLFKLVFTTIKKEERNVHHFTFNASMLARWSAFQLQLYAETIVQPDDDTIDTVNDPLMVTAFWQGVIKSWKIPVTFINETLDKQVSRFSDNTVGKTIWQYKPKGTSNKSADLTVEVSSYSVVEVYYKLRIIALKDFIVQPSISSTRTVTPKSPAFFKFEIPKGWDNVFIHAISESDVCATLTVEQPRGPFLDMDDGNEKIQFSETFTKKTGMAVKAENFKQGLLLAFTPFSNDKKCAKSESNEDDSNNNFDNEFRKKVITFQIRQGAPLISYIIPVFLPLLLFFLIAVFVFVLMVVFHRVRHITVKNDETKILQRCLSQYTSNISITDLIVTEPSRVVDQSRRYCAAGFVTSAFYSVPVFQLIFTFSRQLIETGNFDLCYFNHFCSHMLGIFHDFNHIFSNIWYVLFGLLYMVMVRIRQLTFDPNYTNHEAAHGKGKVFLFFHRADGRMDRGVMTHYGLLYCMGYALIMTGVMSAAYHICPNQRNFQFDTVFMYTIAAITVVTLYQARHPTYLSANFTFTALALVTSITVMGLLWKEFFIRVIFSAVHMLFLVLSLPKVFYSGYIRRNDRLVVHWVEVMKILYIKIKDDFKNHRVLKIQRDIWYVPNNYDTMIIPGPGRIILPGFLLLINCLAIAAMWTLLRDQNFATQVLFICVINGSLYIIFYSVLKLFHGECRRVLWIQPFLYLIASFALWGTAMSFFFDEVSTWESSPAESRLKNTDCIALSFYDSHDMWHFLSAAALFFSAMVLLTVDDDLVDQPKSTIPVF